MGSLQPYPAQSVKRGMSSSVICMKSSCHCVCRCSSVNGKTAPLLPSVPPVLSSVPPPPPPPASVPSSFARLDTGSADIKHEPKSPMPPDSVGGPGIGLNLVSSGGGVDPSAGGSAFGESGMACNGHAPRYSGLVTPGTTADVTGRCPGAVGPTLLDDDDVSADCQPPAKRLHFADSNGWSP